jgi:hypothetical protein
VVGPRYYGKTPRLLAELLVPSGENMISMRPSEIISQPLRLVFARRAGMLLLACMLFGMAQPGWAYSLLTHEALVDILWQDQITPLLLKRFPAAKPGADSHRCSMQGKV